MGANALDPAVRKPSAEAGYVQGKLLAKQVEHFWGAKL
jgi:hypothetical protein